jgi:glycine cleavage system H protein
MQRGAASCPTFAGGLDFPLAFLRSAAVAEIPAGLHYTPEHEYVRRTSDEGVVEVGITDFAQGELGDIVFVELPKAGTTFSHMAVFGTVEAVKAVSELFSPLSGTIVESNAALEGDPGLINRDPYGAGWMIRLKLSNPAEFAGLLDAKAYEAKISG